MYVINFCLLLENQHMKFTRLFLHFEVKGKDKRGALID